MKTPLPTYRPQDLNSQLWLLVLGLINLEALAGFILFLIILGVVVVWLIYKFALIILPVASLAAVMLLALAVQFHWISEGTIKRRSERRIASILEALHLHERWHTPRQQLWPLEQRLRQAAQAQVNALWEDHRRCEKRFWNKHSKKSELRILEKHIESLRLSYEVVPEHGRWPRFMTLHLERDWIRSLSERPRTAFLLSVGVLTVTTAVMVAVLERL